MFKIKKAAIFGVALMSCMSLTLIPVKSALSAELTCTVPPQGKIVTVSSVTALKSAVAKATGNVTIQLMPGNYGNLDFLSGKNPSGPITITSANKSNMAIIESTRISKASNITLRHLKFFADGSGKVPSWGNIKPPNDSYDGLPRQPGKTALRVTDSRNITVADSFFSGHNRATMMSDSTNVKVIGNLFTNTTMDHMAFTGMNNLLIEGNRTGGFKTFWASHNDSIQFWSTGKNAKPSTFVTIRNNVITSSELPGSKGGVQGIFIFNEKVVREGGTTKDYYRDIVVEDNIVITSHPNAITLSATTGLKVRNNVALVDCKNHKKGWEPRIVVFNGSTGVTLTGNTTNILHASTGNPTVKAAFPKSWKVAGNTVTKECRGVPSQFKARSCGGKPVFKKK